jgi:hypothetical protein
MPTLGNIGWGMDISTDKANGEIVYNFINLYYISENRNVGIQLTPFFGRWQYNDSCNYLSFFNFGVQYNLFSLIRIMNIKQENNFIPMAGPHIFINYIGLENNSVDFSKIIINSGLKLNILARITGSRFFAKAIEIDIGYRFNNYENNYNRFYFNINIDVIGAIAFTTTLMYAYAENANMNDYIKNK